MAMAVADEVTEQYAAAMEEAIASATKAEAERDTALARVAELDLSCLRSVFGPPSNSYFPNGQI